MGWAENKWILDSLTKKLAQSPNNMRAFSAEKTSDNKIRLTFLEPADSYENGELICKVAGVTICYSDIGYPATPEDGTTLYTNTELGRHEELGIVTGSLTPGATYYFSAFPFSEKGVFNMSKNSANRAFVVL
jgi:hypothetical protein